MYTALGIDIERVSGPAKVAPPTQVPLWYLFDSKREVINNCALPSTFDILQLERICNSLGDNSGFFLATYLKVAKIIDEEVQMSLTGASPIGELQNWDDGLSAALIHQSASIHSAVGRAAYQLSDYCVPPEIGRCRHKESSLWVAYYSHSSSIFLFGMLSLLNSDAVMHDKGIPLSDSLWKVLEADDQIGRVIDQDLLLLTQKVFFVCPMQILLRHHFDSRIQTGTIYTWTNSADNIMFHVSDDRVHPRLVLLVTM